LLLQDNIHLPHRSSRVSHALEQLKVASAMTKDPVTLQASVTVFEALEKIKGLTHSSYPVLDEGRFLGIVTEARLRRTSAENRNDKTVKSILNACPHVFSDYPLVRAVVRMQQSDSRQLGVLDNKNNNEFVGLLTMSDIVRAHAEAAMSVEDPDLTISPEFTEAAELVESGDKATN